MELVALVTRSPDQPLGYQKPGCTVIKVFDDVIKNVMTTAKKCWDEKASIWKGYVHAKFHVPNKSRS